MYKADKGKVDRLIDIYLNEYYVIPDGSEFDELLDELYRTSYDILEESGRIDGNGRMDGSNEVIAGRSLRDYVYALVIFGCTDKQDIYKAFETIGFEVS